MVYWVLYDISKNKIRSKVANTCKDYGLERVQKSAFLGSLTKNKAEMLAIAAEKLIEKEKMDKVFIVPAGKEEYAKKIILGNIDESIIQRPEVIFLG